MTASSTAIHTPASQSLGAIVVQFTRQTWAGLRVLLGLTVVLGIGYPAAVLAAGQLAFPWQANGSLITSTGQRSTSVTGTGAHAVVGSALIGQSFTGPTWFHPRPSAAGDGYDTLASAGSNLGPNNADLLATVQQRRQQVAADNGVAPATVPADALTASASGLDSDISPAYARLQVARIAAARGIAEARVAALVSDSIQGRTWGLLGDPRVDVLRLNIALETMVP